MTVGPSLRLSQADLARDIRTSRQWVVGLESGAPRAEVQLVLRALDRLGLLVDIDWQVSADDSGSATGAHAADAVDLDRVIADHVIADHVIATDRWHADRPVQG